MVSFEHTLVLLVGFLSIQRNAAVEPAVATGGSCKEYPIEGGECSNWLGGNQVYMFSGEQAYRSNFTARDEAFMSFFNQLLSLAETLASKKCLAIFKLQYCVSWFPACDQQQRPQKQCMKNCDLLFEECGGLFKVGIEAGVGDMIPTCTDTIGEEKSTTSQLNVDYLAEWKGEPVFSETETYVDSALGGEPITCSSIENIDLEKGPCRPIQCAEPLVEVRLPLMLQKGERKLQLNNSQDMEYCLDKTHDLDCKKCDSLCELPCPYPLLYSEGEQTSQLLAYIIPGFLGVILNSVVVFSEHRKLQKMKKKDSTDRLIQISGVLSIILFVMQTLPATILGKNVRCDGVETFSVFQNIEGNSFCNFAKLNTFVFQALMFSVAANLYKVRRQVEASQKMKKFSPSGFLRAGILMFVFGIPSLCAIVSYAIQADKRVHSDILYRNEKLGVESQNSFVMLAHPNNLRHMYTCGFFYQTVEQEYLLVSLPLGLSAFASILFACLLLNVVVKMAVKDTKNEAIYKLAINMLRFGGTSIVLGIVNIAATALFMPRATEFGIRLHLWTQCLKTGVNLNVDDLEESQAGQIKTGNTTKSTDLASSLATCGTINQFAPSNFFLVFIALSQTLPPMLFGFTFAYSSLKLLFALARVKIAPSSQGSRRSSGASSASQSK